MHRNFSQTLGQPGSVSWVGPWLISPASCLLWALQLHWYVLPSSHLLRPSFCWVNSYPSFKAQLRDYFLSEPPRCQWPAWPGSLPCALLPYTLFTHPLECAPVSWFRRYSIDYGNLNIFKQGRGKIKVWEDELGAEYIKQRKRLQAQERDWKDYLLKARPGVVF